MSFTSPLGLLALLAVPAVVVLHLFRNRLPQRAVAALFLFPPQALLAGAGRTRTRLLRTPSFWCEVAAATVLGLWLGGLTFGGIEARPLVLVLDDSASMGAKATHEKALQRVRARIAAHTGLARLGILRSGPRPEILLDPREPAADVDAALRRWQPARPRHDVGLTLDLARELAGSDGDVVFVSDETVPAGHEDVHGLGCGQPAANAALTGAERVPGVDGDRLRVRALAFGNVAATTVTLLAGARELARIPVAWSDGRADFFVPWPVGVDALRLQLSPDALALDDVAYVLPAPERTVAIADALPDDVRVALGIERVLAAVPGWRAASERSEAQLVLAAAPGEPSADQIEVVVAPGEGKRLAFAGPFVIDRSTAWCEGLQLAGVTWVAGELELPGRALITAGPHVLASEEPLDLGRRLWLRLDPLAGNLVRSPDWPVLFHDLVQSARAAVPGPGASQVAVGSEIAWRRHARGGDSVRVVVYAPDGRQQELAAGRTAGFVAEQAGLHRWLDGDGRELATFAAHFVDASESDLRAVTAADRPGVPRVAPGEGTSLRDTDIERRVLAALLLMLLIADWWLLQRREA